MTPKDIGHLIHKVRKESGLKQADLAGSAGVGLRFIVDLEAGKESIHLGKALRVLQLLGIKIALTPPAGER